MNAHVKPPSPPTLPMRQAIRQALYVASGTDAGTDQAISLILESLDKCGWKIVAKGKGRRA